MLILSLLIPGTAAFADELPEEPSSTMGESTPAESSESESSKEESGEVPTSSETETDPAAETPSESSADPSESAAESSSEESAPAESSESESAAESSGETSPEESSEQPETSETPTESSPEELTETEPGSTSPQAPETDETTRATDAPGTSESTEEPEETTRETKPARETESSPAETEAPEASGESETETAEETTAEESAETTEEMAETQETKANNIAIEQKHDLTPVWHPEWLGKGDLFRLGVFERANIVLYRVTSRTLRIRDGADISKNVIGELDRGAVIRVLSVEDHKWYFIETKDAEGKILRGYAGSTFLKKVVREAEDPALVHILDEENTAFGDVAFSTYDELVADKEEMLRRTELVNYALEFLGNPYIWGGESLTHGADCSGFVRGVYRKFGISLPRCSYEQCYSGTRIPVDEARPGDLLFYANGRGVYHVMICYSNDGRGNIEVVHARDEKRGIVVSPLNHRIACWATTYEYFSGEEDTALTLEQDPYGEMLMRQVCVARRTA